MDPSMPKPAYCAVLASADLGGYRIERLFLKEDLKQAVRFSDWRGGRFNPRALCLSENDLLILLGDAIAARVFSRPFLDELRVILDAQTRPRYA
jgi:hypothetical protein